MKRRPAEMTSDLSPIGRTERTIKDRIRSPIMIACPWRNAGAPDFRYPTGQPIEWEPFVGWGSPAKVG